MEQSMFGAPLADVEDNLEAQFVKQNSSLDLGNMSARAGYSLAKGVGGLMGMEDPRISEARKVQEAVKELRQTGVDMSDPVTYYKKMAGIFGAAGLHKQADAAAMKALDMEDKALERSDNALARGDKAEDRKLRLQIHEQDVAIKNAQLARELAKAKGKVNGDDFVKLIKDGYANGQLDQESITAAIAAFNKNPNDLDGALKLLKNKAEDKFGPEEKRTIAGETGMWQQNLTTGRWVQTSQASPKTNVSVNSNYRAATDLTGLRNRFSDELKPYRESITSLGTVSSQLALASTNPQAADAARTQFMRVFRVDANTDKASIERSLNAGALDDRVAQSIQGFLTGTLTPTKIQNMKEALGVVAKKQREGVAAIKKNYQHLPVDAPDKAFITGTADIDGQLDDLESKYGGTGGKAPSKATQDLLDKYKGK